MFRKYFASVLTLCIITFNCAMASTPSLKESDQTGATVRKPSAEIVVSMDVDVDGAPKAYGPINAEALDNELSAHFKGKKSGKVVGYLVDLNGNPILQNDHDPAPGFYISTTGYVDANNKNANDPRRYVNAAEINYTLLATKARNKGVKTGDFCVVHSIKFNKTVYAIVGDTGHPNGKEGSLALLQRLGYAATNGKTAPETSGIVVRYFSKSNLSQQFFFKQSDLDEAAKKLNLDTDFSNPKYQKPIKR